MLRFLIGEDMEILDKTSLQFHCNCSRKRSEAMLRALGKEELQSILDELGQAEVNCQFCNETFLFDGDQLKSILKKSIDIN